MTMLPPDYQAWRRRQTWRYIARDILHALTAALVILGAAFACGFLSQFIKHIGRML